MVFGVAEAGIGAEVDQATPTPTTVAIVATQPTTRHPTERARSHEMFPMPDRLERVPVL
ncbi:hypothetical protein NN3_12820 [Nocardia neocaledoniensis NBRC 108232]|nr:hypothetical protein NN3_12820 [Nocardia neocaledoniensis NBRC 108232]